MSSPKQRHQKQTSGKSSPEPSAGPREAFPQTRWSVVLAACDRSDLERASVALDALCRAYWFPLYVFLRRSGHSPQDAEDLTQGYFIALIERDYLAQADRTRGKLRSFLLTTLKHYISDQFAKSRTLKRGHGKSFVSIDAVQAEERYALEPADVNSPDLLYEKRWALTLLENVLAALQEDYARSGKGDLCSVLQPFLAWNSSQDGYAEVARQLGMTESAIRVAIFRLRRRYGELLRSQVAETLASPEDVPAELDHLFALLRS